MFSFRLSRKTDPQQELMFDSWAELANGSSRGASDVVAASMGMTRGDALLAIITLDLRLAGGDIFGGKHQNFFLISILQTG